MGLVLYSSADGDPSPSCRDRLPFNGDHADSSFSLSGGVDAADHAYLADLVSHNRHLPPSRAQIHDWRCGPSKTRLSARRQSAWAARYWYEYHDKIYQMREESEVNLLKHSSLWPRRLRPHQISILQRSSNVYYRRWYDCSAFANGPYLYGGFCRKDSVPHVRGQRKSVRDDWINHTSIDNPARSPVLMPPPTTRYPRRPPSLERQGAFRAASTTKKLASRTPPDDLSCPCDADEAELYRLGILYDDEHERGSGFGLDTIVHDAPMYTISTGRRRGRARSREPAEGLVVGAFNDVSSFEDAADFTPLGLDLSFANLADDAALARFLQDEEMAAFLAEVPEAEVPDISFYLSTSPSSSSSSSSSSSQPVVTVIYELAPETEMETDVEPDVEADGEVEADSSHGSEAGDWVVDMDTANDRSDHDHCDDTNTDDSILFRTDADADADSNPDDSWLILRS